MWLAVRSCRRRSWIPADVGDWVLFLLLVREKNHGEGAKIGKWWRRLHVWGLSGREGFEMVACEEEIAAVMW